ncbi:MAG: hypothetical protein V9E89_03050 [Ilumatobacteraceae bacterium]
MWIGQRGVLVAQEGGVAGQRCVGAVRRGAKPGLVPLAGGGGLGHQGVEPTIVGERLTAAGLGQRLAPRPADPGRQTGAQRRLAAIEGGAHLLHAGGDVVPCRRPDTRHQIERLAQEHAVADELAEVTGPVAAVVQGPRRRQPLDHQVTAQAIGVGLRFQAVHGVERRTVHRLALGDAHRRQVRHPVVELGGAEHRGVQRVESHRRRHVVIGELEDGRGHPPKLPAMRPDNHALRRTRHAS